MKKKLFYFDLYAERRVSELVDAHENGTQLFLKYFPKYLKRFSYIYRDGPVASKVKRTKIIQDFQTSHWLKSSQDWRILLANKMKSVKVLSNFDKTPLQFSENLKLFSDLKTIEITITQDSKYFLKKLDSLFPKFLKRLDITFEKKVANDPELLEMLIQNKNILKCTTTLNLGALCSNSHFQSFQYLSSLCPNLLSLTFELSCQNITYDMYGWKYFSQYFEVTTNYLQTIKKFQQLRVLNIDIADTVTFLKDFALPPSVQFLRLNFEECFSKEIMLKLDPNFSDSEASQFFEENQTLLKFYQNFQSLDTFEFVEGLDSDIETHRYQDYLFQGLAKRISSVKKFSYNFAPGSFNDQFSGYPSMKEDTHLASFLKGCHHLGKSLEILEIGHKDFAFAKVDLSAFHGKFSNLSSIKITGQFYDFDLTNDKVGLLLEHISSLGERITEIKLCTFFMGMVEPLLNLLRQVNLLNKLGKVSIELQVKFFEYEDLEDLGEGFVVPINDLKTKEGYQKTPGVSLKLFTNVYSDNMKEFLRVYGEKFESFEILPRYTPFQ